MVDNRTMEEMLQAPMEGYGDAIGGSGSLPSNTVANPRGEIKAITTRSDIPYEGPLIPPISSSLLKEVEREPKATKGNVQFTSSESIVHVHPSIAPISIPKPKVVPKRNLKHSIPYPSRLNKEKLQDKFDIQIHKFLQMFKKLHFNISLAEALALKPKYHKTLKDLLSGLESSMSLADLCASINLMPLSVWKKLSVPKLTPTRMTLELATRSIAYPIGIAEDVCMQVGKFPFPADFVVVDYDVDHHAPLILGRPFLRTDRALVDKLNHPSSGNTTPLSDSLPSLTPFETNDSLLEEFADELALLDPFPWEMKMTILILKLILEKLNIYNDDDDDLFDLTFDNDEWKKLLYGDSYKDINSEKAKDSKMKSLVVEDHIVKSNDLLPQLLDNDSTLLEESSNNASLSSSPFGNEDKVFNPCNTPKSGWQRNVEYPRALLHRSIAQDMRTTTNHVV
nr:hypothetical protein [Tanacetum cinerariifolium]